MNNETKTSVKFNNGVTLRGSYRYAHGGVHVEVVATGIDGRRLGQRSSVVRGGDGFATLIKTMQQFKQDLLALQINQFTGPQGMEIIKKLIAGVDSIRARRLAS